MTTGSDLSRARWHDLGGRPAGAIDWSEHDAEPWQKLATALMYILQRPLRLGKN